MMPSNLLGAAIVCPYIALKRLPVIYAVRDLPVEEDDSGWQFLSKETVSPEDLKVWSLQEVFDYEPSLRAYISVPVGTELWRESISDGWMIKMPGEGNNWIDPQK